MIVNSEALRLPFADATADAALCSPPYWGGLRAYAGNQQRDWPAIAYPPMPGLPPVEIPGQRVALGHEEDPFAFVGHLLQVFGEVRRVLRPAGCLAVNLGDCYSASKPRALDGGWKGGLAWNPGQSGSTPHLPAKNLLLMPWRFALAMQADGWILRSRMPGGVEDEAGSGIEPDIVWHKKSCMPSSVRDRPTVDFEDVLIFSQGPRYFWDQEAGREELSESSKRQVEDAARGRRGDARTKMPSERRDGSGAVGIGGVGAAGSRGSGMNPAGRNMRSVWTINPEPTDEKHFAAWPVALAARLIRVMTSGRGVCPECVDGRPAEDLGTWDARSGGTRMGAGVGHYRISTAVQDNGFRRSCDHDVEPVPATVLDPFAGLGRTWEAARETGRRFIGTDLGLGYCRLALSRNDLEAMARRRNAKKAPEDSEDWGPLFR